MKQAKNELDVDFIGGHGPLTKDEEIAIGEFIRSEKLEREKRLVKGVSSSKKLTTPN